MGGHIVHLTLIAGIQPALQVCFVLAQLHIGNPDLLKAQLTAPVFDRLGEGGKVKGVSLHMRAGNRSAGGYNSARHRS